MKEKLKELLNLLADIAMDSEYKNLSENHQDIIEDLTYTIPFETCMGTTLEETLAKAQVGCG